MDPRTFWENGLIFLDGKERQKKYSLFNLLLIYLDYRPSCGIDPNHRETILKKFPDIFKLKVVNGYSLTLNLLWVHKEPRSPSKKDLSSYQNFQIYVGECLGYSCPGDLIGDYPWFRRYSVQYHLYEENSPEKTVGIYGEVCHFKKNFHPRLRNFSKLATMISIDTEKWKISERKFFTPLQPHIWLVQLDPTKDDKFNFYRIGKENGIKKEILDELYYILDFSVQKNYQNNVSKKIEITDEEIDKISEIFPNMFVFKESKKKLTDVTLFIP